MACLTGLILGIGTAGCGTGGPEPGHPVGSSSGPVTNTAAAGVGIRWQSLGIPGITFAYPADWRSTPYPNGLTPGSTLLLDTLTTPSGATISWAFDAQPHSMRGTAVVNGRAMRRTTIPTDADCTAHGGSQVEQIELSGLGPAQQGIRQLVVTTCTGGQDSPTDEQLGALLHSLRTGT